MSIDSILKTNGAFEQIPEKDAKPKESQQITPDNDSVSETGQKQSGYAVGSGTSTQTMDTALPSINPGSSKIKLSQLGKH